MYGGPQQPAFVNTIVNLTGISLQLIESLDAKHEIKFRHQPLPRPQRWNAELRIHNSSCAFFCCYVMVWPIIISQSIDWHRSDFRSSSVEAYLTPVESQRTNWVTLARHIVRTLISCYIIALN